MFWSVLCVFQTTQTHTYIYRGDVSVNLFTTNLHNLLNMPRILCLCSGTGSVGQPFRAAGWEVIDVDWDGRYNAEIQTDITKWDYKSAFPPQYFSVIWASPDCTQYSRAKTTGPPRDFEKADKLVQACRDIIEYNGSGIFWIENPDSGELKRRPCIDGLPYVRVDYCMYGAPYRKRTRLWTNVQNYTPRMCDMSHCVDGRHPATAQRGYRKDDRRSGDQTFTRDQLHRLPKELCEEIFAICQSSMI